MQGGGGRTQIQCRGAEGDLVPESNDAGDARERRDAMGKQQAPHTLPNISQIPVKDLKPPTTYAEALQPEYGGVWVDSMVGELWRTYKVL